MNVAFDEAQIAQVLVAAFGGTMVLAGAVLLWLAKGAAGRKSAPLPLILLMPAPEMGAGAVREGAAARRAVPTRASPPLLFPSHPPVRSGPAMGFPAARDFLHRS